MATTNPVSVDLQRKYYAETASRYDAMHVAEDGQDEHFLALTLLRGLIDYHQCRSVLDLGAGTGRALLGLRDACPDLDLLGIEPVDALRNEGHKKGLTASELIDGDATNLPLADNSVDVACCFAVLHHIPEPERAVAEMLRVARKMVFISDANNFGQGGFLERTAKQVIRALGLWRPFNLIKTRGKGYTESEGDGIAYSYSVFNSFPQVRAACDQVYLMNTADTRSASLYRGAPHLALVGIKPQAQDSIAP